MSQKTAFLLQTLPPQAADNPGAGSETCTVRAGGLAYDSSDDRKHRLVCPEATGALSRDTHSASAEPSDPSHHKLIDRAAHCDRKHHTISHEDAYQG